MLDYYGLPEDFPRIASRPAGQPHARIAHVEQALQLEIDDRRFLPHLILHELEAWVFVAPETCGWLFDDPQIPGKLARIRDDAGGPELIDDGPATSPSKRLGRLYPGYRKVLHGPMAVAQAGLDALVAACPHAAEWLRRLEAI
jgi:hypothetical protein